MTEVSKSKVWAILIGINAYPAPTPSLGGCVRDVENIEKFLSDNIDASRLNVLKITANRLGGDKQPTYANIVGMINHVEKQIKDKQQAEEKDFVYFHYSGHGGRQLRRRDSQHPPRELSPDNYFESLVLHGDRHLKDYELGRHFDSLADAGANLFAVLDCCHSGGGDRADNRNVRQVNYFLPADPQSEEAEEETINVTGTGHRAASVKPSYWTRARRYTVLAACHPHQFASECKDNNGEKNGALTLTMLTSLETLRQNGQPLTFKSLFWDIRARINLRQVTQSPKLFGIEDRDVFSHGSYSSTRVATVVRADPGRVFLDHGEIHGVKAGEKWGIYPRGVLQLQKPITTITIDQVEAMQASGLLAADVRDVQPGCPVSLDSPVYGAPLHVLVEDTELRLQLMKMPAIGVEFHEPGYMGATYTIRPTSNGHHEIMDTSGTSLPNSPVYMSDTPLVSQIHRFLKTLAHYSRVLNMQNTKNYLQGKLEFEFYEANKTTTVCDGGNIQLVVKNLRQLDPRADNLTEQICMKTLYFSVLNLRADRTVTLLIPNPESEGEESLPVAPDETTTPYTIDMNILETDGNTAQVTDIFKVIVTDKPCSFRNLATDQAIRGGAIGQERFDEEIRNILCGGGDGLRAGSRRISVETKWQTSLVSVTIMRNSSTELLSSQ